jgi:hypothetical protein
MIARLSIYANVDLDLAQKVQEWADGDGAGLYDDIPGYRGSMTLLDRENARVVGIGFYASAGHAEEADALIAERTAGALSQLPAAERDALSSPPESFGLYEVVHRD